MYLVALLLDEADGVGYLRVGTGSMVERDGHCSDSITGSRSLHFLLESTNSSTILAAFPHERAFALPKVRAFE